MEFYQQVLPQYYNKKIFLYPFVFTKNYSIEYTTQIEELFYIPRRKID